MKRARARSGNRIDNTAHHIKFTHTIVCHTTFIVSLKYNFEYTFHAEHILCINILNTPIKTEQKALNENGQNASIINTLCGITGLEAVEYHAGR